MADIAQRIGWAVLLTLLLVWALWPADQNMTEDERAHMEDFQCVQPC